MRKTPQKKTKTPAEAVLETWNDVGNRLVTMAEDWPEEKYTYKLTPNVRSFQEVLLHVAGSNYDFLNQIANTKLGEASNDPPVANYKTKAATVEYLKKSVTDGAALIQKEGTPVSSSVSTTGSATLNTWANTTACWSPTIAPPAKFLRSRVLRSDDPKRVVIPSVSREGSALNRRRKGAPNPAEARLPLDRDPLFDLIALRFFLV